MKNLRKWHRDAAIRAAAGFDIVYVYAGHQLSDLSLLSRYRNRRSIIMVVH